MATLKALCMKCKNDENAENQQEMEDIMIEEKNNRYSARGKCSNCGGNMFAFLSKDRATELLESGAAQKAPAEAA